VEAYYYNSIVGDVSILQSNDMTADVRLSVAAQNNRPLGS